MTPGLATARIEPGGNPGSLCRCPYWTPYQAPEGILDTIPMKHNVNPYLMLLGRDRARVLVGALEPLEPASSATMSPTWNLTIPTWFRPSS